MFLFHSVTGLILLPFIILIVAFELWMFVDLVLNPMLRPLAKILWFVGMLLLHPFVAIVYFFVARRALRRALR